MKTFNEFLKEAEVSGDSNGSAVNLAAGINDGNVVRGNPETLGKVKRKKALEEADITPAKSGLPKQGLPSNNENI